MLGILNRRTGGWLTRDAIDHERSLPAEAVALRCIGLSLLAGFLVRTFTVSPTPGLHGRGLVILISLALTVASVIAARPQKARVIFSARLDDKPWRTVAALAGVIAGAAVLALEQPKGVWQAGPYFVAIIAATRLDLRTGLAVVILFAVAPFMVGSLIKGHEGSALSLSLGTVPWYLIMRMLVRLRVQRDELDASRAAHAEAAAVAERGRIAREMHDVLAHSLSALALQLEATRLLAHEHGSHEAVTRAVGQAHELAASGLDDARRAIAAARGDELPGPERIGALADAFGDQSGLEVALEVSGAPRRLAPDAGLAVYRTAQEALTNVRRHAAAERVQLKLDYRPDSTVLVVEDHAPAGTPPPAPYTTSGYGLTGMRERAKLLGGELTAAPTADGFRVELRLPA